MSTDHHYPEVSGDDSGLVPPQSGPKAEWPKKIRTLTAVELDRLTIDSEGRFYWDGRLVNYQAAKAPEPAEVKPVDPFDRVALEVLDRAALDMSESKAAEPVQAAEPVEEIRPAEEHRSVDQFTPITPVVGEVRHTEAMAPAGIAHAVLAEKVRVKLSLWQSLGLILVIAGFLLGAAGLAAQGLVTAHQWSCRTGWANQYCPKPPPAPAQPARPDIPT